MSPPNFMKQQLVKIVLAAVALLLFGACERGETLLSIAAGSTGGTWHPIGGVMGSMINEYVAGVRVNVESTDGGVENVRLLGTGQVDIAMCGCIPPPYVGTGKSNWVPREAAPVGPPNWIITRPIIATKATTIGAA